MYSNKKGRLENEVKIVTMALLYLSIFFPPSHSN